ncbi:MAG TPA: NAD(P)/FAD-dependent oxidoreductase, partial [Bacteroidetes bacterium]|nr:NAD(P)/FAD-dependent oxidoreductase [Bacteroidota bacterium]
MENEKLYDCIVIGAGQSGLAAGYHLQKAGQTFALLEAQAELTGSFGRYYDSLTLFSPVKHSQLPGFALKGLPGHYPTRLEFIQYLQDYRAHFNLPVKLSTAVQQVHKTPEGFSIITPSATFLSRTVINATGPFIEPNFPQYPGQEDFLGELMHSVDFRNGDNMEGKRILVVGAGNSAIQIAYELSAKAKVSIASRRKIK